MGRRRLTSTAAAYFGTEFMGKSSAASRDARNIKNPILHEGPDRVLSVSTIQASLLRLKGIGARVSALVWACFAALPTARRAHPGLRRFGELQRRLCWPMEKTDHLRSASLILPPASCRCSLLRPPGARVVASYAVGWGPLFPMRRSTAGL